jgi:hypothetical protein
MVKRRSETERSTDRSIDRTSANEASPARLPTPPRLPRPPEPKTPRPPEPKPPRLPDHPVARPGRRGEAPSELVMTHRIERITVEPTPAPLPPSPAAADAERWFEQVPTNPGVPNAHPERRSSSRIPPPESAQQQAQRGAPTWLFPLLLALTALTVGMVIGALVFGRASNHDCPSCSDAAGSPR